MKSVWERIKIWFSILWKSIKGIFLGELKTEISEPINELKLKCVWDMGNSCMGEIKEVAFFNQQITVPVCEEHVRSHKEVMFLHTVGEDVEEILVLSPEERTELYNKKKIEFPDVEETL